MLVGFGRYYQLCLQKWIMSCERNSIHIFLSLWGHSCTVPEQFLKDGGYRNQMSLIACTSSADVECVLQVFIGVLNILTANVLSVCFVFRKNSSKYKFAREIILIWERKSLLLSNKKKYFLNIAQTISLQYCSEFSCKCPGNVEKS